jgi:hypothetical protein
MERSLECSGLNVEADKKAHGQLLTSNIKAHTASFCLSTKPYPLQVRHIIVIFVLLKTNYLKNLSRKRRQ